jgi:hypothetical protein
MRSQFEKWYESANAGFIPIPAAGASNGDHGPYMSAKANAALLAWQAAYRQALEDAIRRLQSCEMVYGKVELEDMYREAGGDVEQLQAQIDARFLSMP